MIPPASGRSEPTWNDSGDATTDGSIIWKRMKHQKLDWEYSLWKRAVVNLAHRFELGDSEYIKATFGPWPFRFFVTVVEPRRRRGWTKIVPARVRCCVASVALSWICRTCTICGEHFSLKELLARPGDLTHFQSGSICHNTHFPNQHMEGVAAK